MRARGRTTPDQPPAGVRYTTPPTITVEPDTLIGPVASNVADGPTMPAHPIGGSSKTYVAFAVTTNTVDPEIASSKTRTETPGSERCAAGTTVPVHPPAGSW